MQYILDRFQLTQLVAEASALRDWTLVRDFCEQVFGSGKVATITLETHGEYNDEGGTDYSVEVIFAKDSQGNSLEYDLNLPFWQHILKDHKVVYGDEQEDAQDALRDWYRLSEDEEAVKNMWLTWNDLPCDIHDGGTTVYDFADQPKLSFAVMSLDYAAEKAALQGWKSS